MDLPTWIPSVVEIGAALILTALGWFARSLRDLRAEIEQLRDRTDAREDGIEARLVRCESVDASGALERLGDVEARINRLEAAQITHEDLGRVYRRLDGVQESVSTMGGEIATAVGEIKGALEATRGQVAIVCQHLMERAAK